MSSIALSLSLSLSLGQIEDFFLLPPLRGSRSVRPLGVPDR